MKFLVFSTDLLPLEGVPTSGTALRTYQIVRGLEDEGHQVVISVPSNALDGFYKNNDTHSLSSDVLKTLNEWKTNSFDASNQLNIVSRVNPDVIFCGHWPAITFLRKPRQPIIVDLAGPHILESHFQNRGTDTAAVLGKLNALSLADYYIVSGQSQKRYFLSYLLRADVNSPIDRIIEIPMPLPENEPNKDKERLSYLNQVLESDYQPKFIFGGIFLPWQDPSPGLYACEKSIRDKNRGTLTLIGGEHPNYKIKKGLYEKLFKNLEKNKNVLRMNMLPYDQFINQLSSHDVAVDLMSWNLERQLAVTIRTTSYLWSGLPVIYNNYSDLSEYIKEYDAGWCVDPKDFNSIDLIFDEIYRNPKLVIQKSKNAFKLAKDKFSRRDAAKKIVNLLKAQAKTLIREADILLDYPQSKNLFLSKSHPIKQKFVGRLPKLNEIRLKFAKLETNEQTQKDVCINLFIYTNKAKTKIYSKVFFFDEIKSDELFQIDIPSDAYNNLGTDDFSGFTYELEISSENITKGENIISPWLVNNSPYPLRELFYADKAIKNVALCMQTYGQVF